MFSEEMNTLIEAALEDGVLTDQKKAVLIKRAQKEGIDLDEFELCLQAILHSMKKAEAKSVERNVRNSNDIVHELQEDLKRVTNEYKPKIQSHATDESQMKKWDLQKRCASEKCQIIQSVVVGQSQTELLSVLAFSKPKANKLGHKKGYSCEGLNGFMFESEDLSYAYWVLFENCINIAKAYYNSEPAFAPYFAFYEQESNKKTLAQKFMGLFKKK